MSHITFTVGPPGAGKTRWAHQEVARRGLEEVQRVNLDDFLTMTHGREFGLLSGPDLTLVRRMLVDIIRSIAESGRDVIVDGANLSTRFPRRVRDELGDNHRYGVQDFTGQPLEFCINNDRNRYAKNPWAYVGSAEVNRTWSQGQALRRRFGGEGLPLWVEELNRPDGIVPYLPDAGLPKALIVDIDGTLSRVDPAPARDTSGLGDGLDHRLAKLLGSLTHGHGTHVVLLTSRGEECHDVLLEWLSARQMPYGEVHMRPRGDSRRDGAVKLDLFDRHVRHRFNVVAAFYDREHPLGLWHRLGLLACALQ
jgi:hypothetical protein